MRHFLFLIVILACMTQSACSPSARSQKSFDEIRRMVSGKTEAEVEKLLGAPDYYEKLPFGDERWTWWNYTYLGGKSWAPAVRGKVVHLEITFAGPMLADLKGNDKSLWRVSEPYGVGFVISGEEAENQSSPLNKSTRNSI